MPSSLQRLSLYRLADLSFAPGSVPARLDAFLAQTPASRADALGSQTGSGSGFAWAKDCAYVADGRLALVLAGFVVGLDDTDEADDGMTPAEARGLVGLVGAKFTAPTQRVALPRSNPFVFCFGRMRAASGGRRRRARSRAPRWSCRAHSVTDTLPPSFSSPPHTRSVPLFPQRSAWSLLGYYYEHALSDVDVLKTELVAGLSSLSGDWAFVLCDRTHHRVVAARSSSGASGL